VGVQNHCRVIGIKAGKCGDQTGQVAMERRNHLTVDELVGRGRGKLLAGDEFAQIDRVILGQQQNHILTGAQNQYRIAALSGEGVASSVSAASACGRKLWLIKSAIHWAQAR
jgi:hypothetical protein